MRDAHESGRRFSLADLEIGQTAVIEQVGGAGELRQHFLDMGVIPGASITLEQYAPMGDPAQYRIHGYELTLRLAQAQQIQVRGIGAAEGQQASRYDAKAKTGHNALEGLARYDVAHPGLGEGGKHHDSRQESPLPADTVLAFALAGNQSCGKTTLFNQFTGSKQHVGNFPGVTVDKKTRFIKGHDNTEVVDLPGIYSMSPYSSEELVSRHYILEARWRRFRCRSFACFTHLALPPLHRSTASLAGNGRCGWLSLSA